MKIRIGTRKSRLALIQTDLVRLRIEAAFPEVEVEIVEMSTKGDELLDRSLTSFGGKGVFTRELEEALLEEKIDLAVHSAKDMPMEFPEGLYIGAVLPRADVRDVLVTRSGVRAADLAPGSIVGTSSLRRELQIKELNPMVQIKLLRGNVQTRIRKLKEGGYDAILLAAAGLERLGITEEEGICLEYLDPEEFLPAAGQGILAVEAKEGRLTEILSAIHCPEAALELEAERSFLKAIGGSCNAPAAGLCRLEEGRLHMKVLYAPEGTKLRRAEESDEPAAARRLGETLARKVKRGKVWLLGAGPGDMGLLTEKALAAVRAADVLVYDNLASAAVLNEARRDAELIYAGKRADRHHLRQEETNALLVEKALEGKNVARVKGGDPFIFGRGGEEAQELLKAGVEFEIIPGVSSSYAAPAYAGIPVTHRDYASSFHVITGHESASKEGTVLDYATLAREEGTLVFLMGLRGLPRIASELMKNGKDPKTPAAVIQEGTTARQRTVFGTLQNIADRAKEAGIQTPAITLIGGVAALGEQLSWWGKGALSGVRVLLTGTPSMCEKQKRVLEEDGAEVIPFSLIDTRELEEPVFLQAMEELSSYTWLVFTSSNGVELFLKALKKERKDIRKLSGLRFAVIGEGTKMALENAGIYADFVPSRYSSEDMAREWIPELTPSDRVLLLRAREASQKLPEALGEAGIPCTDAPLYETVRDERKAEELNRLLADVDYVTFASASAVKAFAAFVPEPEKLPAKAVCIGPVTEKAAAKAGIPVYASAVVYTAEGIRDVLRKDRKYGRI